MLNNKLYKRLTLFISSMIVFLATGVAYAANTPEGLWKTIDDETGEPKSIVQINKNNMGEYTAKVVKILKTDDGSDPETRACDKCSGARKNQRIKGMTILWGVKQNGDEYTGGEILDPKTGTIYRVKFSLDDNGKRLNVRGFVGFSLFGRTQVWHRMK